MTWPGVSAGRGVMVVVISMVVDGFLASIVGNFDHILALLYNSAFYCALDPGEYSGWW